MPLADFLQTKLGEHMTENVIFLVNYNFYFHILIIDRRTNSR